MAFFHRELDAARPRLFSTKSQLPRQIAAGALDRISGCLDGIEELRTGRAPALAGLILRHAYECWIVGLCLCFDGEDARQRLIDADATSLRKVAALWPDGGWATEAGRYATRDGNSLNIRAIADRVRRHLDARPFRLLDPLQHYDSMYRLESRATVHAGVESLARHLEYNRRRLRLGGPGVSEPRDDAPLAFALAYGSHLGAFVFESFGLSSEGMVWILKECLELFDDPPATDDKSAQSDASP